MCRLPCVEELLLSLQLGLLTRQIFMVPIRYSGPRRPPETGAHSLATGPADRGLGSVGGLGALPWCSLGNSAAHYHPQTPLPLPGPSSPCSHTGCSLVFDHPFRAWSETFSLPNLLLLLLLRVAPSSSLTLQASLIVTLSVQHL